MTLNGTCRRDFTSTHTAICTTTTKTSTGKGSNDNSSLSCSCGTRGVRHHDTRVLLGARLCLVALETWTRKGNAPSLAADICKCRSPSSHRSGSPLYFFVDADRSRQCGVRTVGTLGFSRLSSCGTLCPFWKGSVSLVASFVVSSPVHNVFLIHADCLKTRLCLRRGPARCARHEAGVEFGCL